MMIRNRNCNDYNVILKQKPEKQQCVLKQTNDRA